MNTKGREELLAELRESAEQPPQELLAKLYDMLKAPPPA